LNSTQTWGTVADPVTNNPSIDSEKRTKGMIIGWRDRGYPGTAPSGLEFVVLPTLAQNDQVWGKSVVIAESVSGQGADAACREELGFKVGSGVSTESRYSISAADSGFAYYSIICNHTSNSISLFVNGEFLASSVCSDAFKTKEGKPLQIPSKIGSGHFHASSTNGLFESLYTGGLPNTPILTPWVLGGGFTDNIADSPLTSPTSLNSTLPGFLGTNTNTSYFINGLDSGLGPYGQHTNGVVPGLGGYEKTGLSYAMARSSLEGYIGSFKMYSKPLSIDEVTKNYNAQRPYFSGISLPKVLL
jgi:hypothetical protein